jgi:CheY-like chemotaxis protein
VECMGGVLRVDSQPGRGSTFHFTAKFEMPALTPRKEQPQTKPASANGLSPLAAPVRARVAARILVAEDSLDNQFLIEAYLKGSPYSFTFVADGRAAVKQFQDGVFDVVLMDMQMPIMDGLTATRAIREIEDRQGRRTVPIVALTANAHREAIQACLSAGCTAHLSKPISKAGLLRAVRNNWLLLPGPLLRLTYRRKLPHRPKSPYQKVWKPWRPVIFRHGARNCRKSSRCWPHPTSSRSVRAATT